MTSEFEIMMDNLTPPPKISYTIYQAFSNASLAKPLSYPKSEKSNLVWIWLLWVHVHWTPLP